MTALLVGYARCSTDQRDLTAQRDGLAALGVASNRVYVDHGLTVEVDRKCTAAEPRVGKQAGEAAHRAPEARICHALHPVGQR